MNEALVSTDRLIDWAKWPIVYRLYGLTEEIAIVEERNN
jgi:hypothetical protein